MWSQSDGRLSTITKVHFVRYLLQNGVNTIRYLLSNGVKVLSPKMRDIALGEVLIVPEAGIAAYVNGDCVSNMLGSKSMVGNRIAYTGTWENHIVPKLEASYELKRRRRKYGDTG